MTVKSECLLAHNYPCVMIVTAYNIVVFMG